MLKDITECEYKKGKERIMCKHQFNDCSHICSENRLYDVNIPIQYGCKCPKYKIVEEFTSNNRENNHNLIVMMAIVSLFSIYVVCRKMY